MNILRKAFLDFYINLGFHQEKTQNIIQKNSDLLFVNSGMVPLQKLFKNSFLNIDVPYEKIANSQFCVRISGKHNDLSEVGFSNQHITSFEMLGNFIFKNLDIEHFLRSCLSFLTTVCNLEKEFIHITVHPSSKNIYEIWKKISPNLKIIIDNNNFWEAGKEGSSGFCTEIYYKDIEIWNIVIVNKFYGLKEDDNQKITMVDAGMGLERLSMFFEKKTGIYSINLYADFIIALKQSFVALDNQNEEQTTSIKIIIDHIKTSFAIILYGIKPSNKLHGYVLRKLLRITILHLNKLQQDILSLKSFLYKLFLYFKEIVDIEINESVCNEVLNILIQENTLLIQVEKNLEKFLKHKEKINKKDLDFLFDTYGANYEMVKALCLKKSIIIE